MFLARARVPITLAAHDWIGTLKGIELIRNKSRIDIDQHAIREVYFGGSATYVQILVSEPSRFSEHVTALTPVVRRLPSLWDYLCVVHGPSPKSSLGSCRRCGRSSFMRIIWRDPDSIGVIVGPVTLATGRVFWGGKIFEPSEVVELLEDRKGQLYARVLLFAPVQIEIPDDLRIADSSELIGWTKPEVRV